MRMRQIYTTGSKMSGNMNVIGLAAIADNRMMQIIAHAVRVETQNDDKLWIK